MISKWLLCISRSMDEFSDNNDTLEILRAFPMILLTNGKVVSLESQTVFFPLSTLEKEATRISTLFKSFICWLNFVVSFHPLSEKYETFSKIFLIICFSPISQIRHR